VPAAPKVFISYSHDSDAHKERVLALADERRMNLPEAQPIEAILEQNGLRCD
jgi:hypothetical protein